MTLDQDYPGEQVRTIDPVSEPTAPSQPPRRRPDLGLVAAAWILSIGIDFLLHGGLLARLYLRESPFLLPPQDAFARIPLGYLSFLILSICLWWFLRVMRVRGAAPGFRIGLMAGAAIWGALLLGLFTVSTATADLLAAWWVGQSLELGAAGAVIGAGFSTGSRRGIYLRVAVAFLACTMATVILQSIGWAPPMQTTST